MFLIIKGNHQDNIEKLQSQIIKLLYVPLNYHDYAKYIFFFVTSKDCKTFLWYSTEGTGAICLSESHIQLFLSMSIFSATFLDKQLSWSTTFTVHKYITGKHTCMQHAGVRTYAPAHTHTHTHTHTKIHQNFTKTKAPNIYSNT